MTEFNIKEFSAQPQGLMIYKILNIAILFV